ncbi:MAG TPA: hypothetical protein VEZ59_02065, partial [Sphingopyxis sp.]|nr:hypothetical protein [Sphingopyxis sp.]
TDGADARLFKALTKAVDAAGAVWELVAPKIGGITLSDGTSVAGRHKIDGGPSVLFDAVALLPSDDGAAMLAGDAPAKDFVSDAFAHCKYIGHSAEAAPLFAAAGLEDKLDEGCIALAKAGDATAFLDTCGALRHWPREEDVDLDAKTGGYKEVGDKPAPQKAVPASDTKPPPKPTR